MTDLLFYAVPGICLLLYATTTIICPGKGAQQIGVFFSTNSMKTILSLISSGTFG
ncbi:unnamed protein product [Protopolystoma xenopodis]|uniref:Uncharacterized protein n=1 Tax=Protopolystoma xenopodis TaxID=117903 RepID=A0A3S5CQ72_9PLAT|nr:unnamed protein product [Protopolystoma xenopodis]